MSRPTETLRKRLLRAVFLPALVVVALSAVYDYTSAVAMAQQAQDNALLKMALSLATRLSPDEEGESREDILHHFEPNDMALFRADPVDDIRFVVLDAKGEFLVGDKPLIELMAGIGVATYDKPRYADRMLGTEAVRVITFAHSARGVALQLAITQTNRTRRATTHQILINTIWPNLVLLLVMFVLMYHGIAKALAPLKALSQSIDDREVQDLTPVPQEQIPGEIRPFVTAINGMLGRLGKATAEQQMFLSGAAHQLRTPLAGIQTQLELAMREATPAIAIRLGRILDAVGRLAHCTQQMLTLARSSAQASTAHDLCPVDLPSLIEDAASTWLDAALQRQTELDFELEPAQCLGSSWMLHELLGNLIDNAIKHNPPGGRVTVRCGVTPDRMPYLEIEDQGPGIAESDRHRVFEPFFRSAQGMGEGSGLGLPIAREVANRHKANIELLAGSGQKGTRIRVTFPAMAVVEAMA